MVARLTNLENLLIEQLQDLYSAENQQIVAIPRLMGAALNPAMVELLEEYLQGTKDHIRRLEDIFATRLEHLRGRKCQGMEGILQESIALTDDSSAEPSVMEAGLLAALLKAKTYEIAVYSTALTYAVELQEEAIASALTAILDEERQLNKRLERMMKAQATQAAEVENL
jgi:ferritin-like metal-binding protein YciE